MKIIEPQRLYRRIAEEIRGGVVSGQWPVGTRLPPERDLAILLGVSRPSLREALIALEVEGLIEVRTGSGIYVREVLSAKPRDVGSAVNAAHEWGPLEVMRARQVIEVEVAAMAAGNARKGEIAVMHDALRLMRQEVANGQAPRRGDEAFHVAIAKACGNDVLTDMVQRTWEARDGAVFERLGQHFEKPGGLAKKPLTSTRRFYTPLSCMTSAVPGERCKCICAMQRKRYSASWKRPVAA